MLLPVHDTVDYTSTVRATCSANDLMKKYLTNVISMQLVVVDDDDDDNDILLGF